MPAMPSETASTETPAPDGPLLIYQTEGARRDVVVFDVGTGRELWRFAPTGPYTVSQARRTIIEAVADPRGLEVRERALADGMAQRLHVLDRSVTGIAVSPDGTTLAFGTTDRDQARSDESIQLLGLASGETRELIRFENPLRGLQIVGRPEPLVWRADGLGVVFRYYPGSGPALLLSTVLLDGRLLPQGHFAYHVSPDGRFAVNDGINTVGCLDTHQQFRIIDLMTGASTVVVEDPLQGLRFASWAPASDALLYEQYETYELGSGACVRGLDQPSRRDILVTVPEGTGRAIDAEATRRSWYGGYDIVVKCAGAVHQPSGTCDVDQSLTIDGAEIAREREIEIIQLVQSR